MKERLEQLRGMAGDGVGLVKRLLADGVESVSAVWGKMDLVGSLRALTSKEVDRVETHYLLVPIPGEERGVLYTKKVVPEGWDGKRELSQVRVFHVPSVDDRGALEGLLREKWVAEMLPRDAGDSPLADRLEALAEQIDKETQKVSGGLLLIGGAVALFNPLVGLAVAAKSLFPSVGAAVGKAGAGYVGDKLRGFGLQRARKGAEKEANKEVQRLRPELRVNPVLRDLTELIENSGRTSKDLDELAWVEDFEEYREFELSAEAVSFVPDGRSNGWAAGETAALWLENLKGYPRAAS